MGKLLTREDVAKEFVVCKDTIRNWDNNNVWLPGTIIRINQRVIRYDADKVAELIKKQAGEKG